MASRDAILGRIRAALQDVPRVSAEVDVAVEWEYGQPPALVPDDVIGQFVERVEDYRALVSECSADDLPAVLARVLQDHGASSVVLPSGLPSEWRDAVVASGAQVVSDDPPLTSADLDGVDAVVTASVVGIAATGTIVLDHGPDQGRRAVSLVPDLHVCVVRTDQVVMDVPEAVARLADSAAHRRPQTWISGPSATSDIELSRVEGVHGPRTLHVVLVD